MFEFSVPSKTFLIGEYAVLEGGTGLLVGTEPRFRAVVTKVEEGEEAVYEGMSMQGPAMDFLKDRIEIFSNYSVRMFDPHEERGGLGWSSAQFVLLYAINAWIINKHEMPKLNNEKVLEDYLSYAWNGDGWAPSGLDVLCHLEGGLMEAKAPQKFEAENKKSVMIESLSSYSKWPFEELDFCLIRTGTKVATHAHLSNLKKIPFEKLSSLAKKAGQSLKNIDEELFLSCVNEYREELIEQNLAESNSLKIYKTLQDRPEVLAYKGCGALGADIILVIVIKDLKSDFEDWANENDFKWVGSSKSLSSGLVVEELNDLAETSSNSEEDV